MNSWEEEVLHIKNYSYKSNLHKTMKKTITHMCGVHYRWGGESERGVDCSGFVRLVYKKVGYDLPHSARSLQHIGMSVEYPAFGDIIVFRGRGSWHTGIYMGNLQFVHASSAHGYVTVSDLHRYRGIVDIRRLF